LCTRGQLGSCYFHGIDNCIGRSLLYHLHLAVFRSMPKVRALCSAGVTQPRHSYDPVRLPPWPLPSATLRTLPSPVTGLPRLPEPPFRRAVPTTRRIERVLLSIASPLMQPSPNEEGRHPHCHFRGLLRLHSRYGPPDRSATQGDLCHEAPAQPVPNRTARQLPDLSTSIRVRSPSLRIRALGAHCHFETWRLYMNMDLNSSAF